ncbi:MAG: hypothetical protein J5967_06730 [Oscillospiraceae bacterium]|nr:hypothetical protein [Oscillospiraceae bacterium]
MVLRMLLALLAAFAVSAGFGKVYVPWLKKKKAAQPLKDEVARIYAEKTAESDEKGTAFADGGERHG